MKFKELDKKLRVFETASDFCVLPELFMVARIDGRNFTRLTKEILKCEAPFDTQFRDCMLSTVKHLMDCGFRTVYGYTQSDEISLLFHRDEKTFGRKLRKFNSILAGEASAFLTLLLNNKAAFDCRISQLPTVDLVVDYFRWRNEDAHRNALNAHCYWTLRNKGETATTATKKLDKLSISQKNELLYQQAGLNFNEVPNWQKRGVGVYWESYQKEGINPITGEHTNAIRRQLKVDMELPMKDNYSEFIRQLVLLEHT